MVRIPHILKPEKSLSIPRHFVFFDTETEPIYLPNNVIEHNFKLGWCCYYRRAYKNHNEKEEWFYFEDEQDFWSFVCSKLNKKQKLWIISRNIAFDFTVLKGFTYLRSKGFKLKFFYNNNTTTILSLKSSDYSIVLLDSLNWFVESIEQTGKRLNLQKLDIDFENCTKEELKEYCKRDVEIDLENFKVFIQFMDTMRLGRICYTQSATAMSIFLHSFYKKPIYIHNNRLALKLERQAYKGGRTECFYLGALNTEPYYLLDVNSLYPFVMRCYEYPVRYITVRHNPTIKELGLWLENYSVVARCLVSTQDPVYAIKKERTIFPIGRFEAYLTTPELIYALKNGHILTIYEAVIYERANIFRDYVDTLYAMRKNFEYDNNYGYAELCKKMLNSLYGKFGQKAENWVKIGEAPYEPDRVELVIDYESGKRTKIQYILGDIYMLQGETESFDSFPAISAHITAYGRMYLWLLMQKAGQGNYFYCDTDSLIVNQRGYDNLSDLLSSDKIGHLKIVDSANHIVIRGLKDYTFGDKVVIKGISRQAVRIGDDIYRQQQWSSFKGVLRSGDTNSYKVNVIEKHLNREYLKGEVSLGGFVRPYVFS